VSNLPPNVQKKYYLSVIANNCAGNSSVAAFDYAFYVPDHGLPAGTLGGSASMQMIYSSLDSCNSNEAVVSLSWTYDSSAYTVIMLLMKIVCITRISIIG
jgi:hypothetical protein